MLGFAPNFGALIYSDLIEGVTFADDGAAHDFVMGISSPIGQWDGARPELAAAEGAILRGRGLPGTERVLERYRTAMQALANKLSQMHTDGVVTPARFAAYRAVMVTLREKLRNLVPELTRATLAAGAAQAAKTRAREVRAARLDSANAYAASVARNEVLAERLALANAGGARLGWLGDEEAFSPDVVGIGKPTNWVPIAAGGAALALALTFLFATR